jgi:uncharacterized membrane protein
MKLSLASIITLIIIANLFDTIRELMLKSAINSLREFSPTNIKKIITFIARLIMIPRVWLSLLCSILSLCVWLFVLSKADLNFAFSLDSMHYIFIAIASKIILKEKVGFSRWTGTILIIIGITLVSLS